MSDPKLIPLDHPLVPSAQAEDYTLFVAPREPLWRRALFGRPSKPTREYWCGCLEWMDGEAWMEVCYLRHELHETREDAVACATQLLNNLRRLDALEVAK